MPQMPPSETQYPARDDKGISIRHRLIALILRTMLVTIAGLLSCCIDGHEEYWIEQDGSGRAQIRYTIPSSVARMEGGDEGLRKILGDFLKSNAYFSNSNCEVVTENSTTRVTIRATFESALKLCQITSDPEIHNLPSAVNHLIGTLKSDLHGRTLELTRTASPAKAIPGAFLMPASSFQENHLVYLIHLPFPASESNATLVTDGGRTLRWDIPLADTLNSPVITRFKLKLPVLWKSIFAFGFCVFLVCEFVYSLVKYCRERRKNCNK